MEVLARWGLSDARVESVITGATNQTWRIDDGAQTWFLRRYRSADEAVVRREHDLIARLADAGVLTPRLVPTSTGDSVVVFDGALFAVFESAAGRQLEPEGLDAEHAASAGEFLGRLHTATAGISTRPFRRLALRWDGAAWAARVRQTAELIPQESASDIDRWAASRSHAQAEWLADSNCRHSYVPLAEHQVIHGDYQHANLFFDGSTVSAVIDWDTVMAMPRGFVVVRACSFMFHLDSERTDAFISAYRAASTLSVAELDDGARAWGCFADHHVWPTEERYRNGNRAAERFIERRPFEPFEVRWKRLDID